MTGTTPFRILPRIGPDNEFFWTSGADGRLRFLRCRSCGQYVHPPSPRCPTCLSTDVTPEVVSGRATVATFTLNHQPWGFPGFDLPYAIAIVAIDDDPSVRLMTNIVGCPPEEVHIGQRVHVVFEQHGEIFIPLFTPDDVGDGGGS